MQNPTDQTPESHEPVELDPARVAAFLCDSRASTLLLRETVVALVRSQRIEHMLVDVETPAGTAIAQACQDEQVQYTVMDFGGMIAQTHGAGVETGASIAASPAEQQIAALRADAVQVIEMDPDQIGRLRAQLCLVPAPIGAGVEHLDGLVEPIQLDLSPTTLPGLAFDQARATERTVVLIDTPERGIVREVGSDHRRRILHVGATVASGPQIDQASEQTL